MKITIEQGQSTTVIDTNVINNKTGFLRDLFNIVSERESDEVAFDRIKMLCQALELEDFNFWTIV